VGVTGVLFLEILVLLAAAVFAVALFHRLRLPSVLAYLLVGAVVGPHALAWVPDVEYNRALAEFGIVFLLFTIGLNFSLPQILALRHLVFGLGTAQVILSTAGVGLIAWLAGLPPVAAFVTGAVFAQSSTTIISKLLTDQGEEQSRHGRLALGMSVFQDITAVPFVIVIPVLGAAYAGSLLTELGWATLKAAAALALIFFAGRRLLKPLFHEIAARRSPELFTLTVLLVTLAAASLTQSLGLSLGLGAFLAGMMLGETEFRHQIEATIRPFRDVLLGLLFVTIGMLLDPALLPDLWHWALLAAAALLAVKTLIVTGLVRTAGLDARNAWSTAIVLAVGGEFGFALLAIALGANVISAADAQIVLMAVLLSMLGGTFLIRYNAVLARWVSPQKPKEPQAGGAPTPDLMERLRGHVLICGYGRVGQSVGRFLDAEGISYVALDLDITRVREAWAAGLPVYYGESTERDMLEAVGLVSARMLLVSFDDFSATLKVLHHARALRPDLPVVVRTRDESHVDELLAAGATEVIPETLEASVMIGSQVLLLADVPPSRVLRRLRELREDRYRLLRGFFRAEDPLTRLAGDERDRLHCVALPEGATSAGRTLEEVNLQQEGVMVTAIRRGEERNLSPDPAARLQAGDVLVLFGSPEDLERAEMRLLKS
jgi:monovalent cation:H+ antiporter-2, CPA2 family